MTWKLDGETGVGVADLDLAGPGRPEEPFLDGGHGEEPVRLERGEEVEADPAAPPGP